MLKKYLEEARGERAKRFPGERAGRLESLISQLFLSEDAQSRERRRRRASLEMKAVELLVKPDDPDNALSLAAYLRHTGLRGLSRYAFTDELSETILASKNSRLAADRAAALEEVRKVIDVIQGWLREQGRPGAGMGEILTACRGAEEFLGAGRRDRARKKSIASKYGVSVTLLEGPIGRGIRIERRRPLSKAPQSPVSHREILSTYLAPEREVRGVSTDGRRLKGKVRGYVNIPPVAPPTAPHASGKQIGFPDRTSSIGAGSAGSAHHATPRKTPLGTRSGTAPRGPRKHS